MSLESTMQSLIEKMLKRGLPMVLTEGTVKSVDKAKNTCDVEREELPELFACRLNSILEAGTDTITVYPKEGAKVVVGMIENNPTDTYIIATNDIEEVVMLGGTNGGLTITPKLVEELGKTNTLLQAILDVISGTPITELGNGAVSALQAQLALAITGKTLGVYDEIENPKITH